MKEQLVTFDTAKLAKEKGFILPTKMYYENSLIEQIHHEDGKSGPFGWEKGEMNLQSGYFINNWKNSDFSNKSWYMCSAPTQSLLQKWLREVHNWNIIVFNDDGDIEFGNLRYNFELRNVTISFKKRNIKNIVGTYEFKTYEEALEKGLQEALKLIKLKTTL